MHLRHLALPLVLLSGLLTGCLFSPEKKAPLSTPPPEYPPPTTINQSLLNMIAAYQARDSVGTENVYDPAYEGTSSDLAASTPTVYTLTRFDEKHHVAALKKNPNIVSVSLDFKSQSTWRRLPPEAGDPPDWAVLQIDFADIQVFDVGAGTTYQSQSRVMLYSFVPTVSVPGDTLWHIIKWTEVRS